MIVVVMTDTNDLDLFRFDTLIRQDIFHASSWADRFVSAAGQTIADGHTGLPNHEVTAMANDVAAIHGIAPFSIKHGIVVHRHVELFEAPAIDTGKCHFRPPVSRKNPSTRHVGQDEQKYSS